MSAVRRSAKGGVDPTPTPVEATPVPTGPRSQIRNNVVLVSRGQSAQILFRVDRAGPVLVAVYNRLGQRIAVLQDGSLAPGSYNLPWSGQGQYGQAGSGIYVVLIRTPDYTDLQKLMLVQ